MKHIFAAIFFLMSVNLFGQIENVLIETYYVSDHNDATDTTGGYLAPGSKTYRIYIDLAPGSKVRKIYGDANHVLRFTSTQDIFNNKADGQSFGKEFTKSRLQENTVALDSWITIGQSSRVSSKTYFGVPKAFDNDGSIIGGQNNDGGSAVIGGGLLVNSDASAGAPLTAADGLLPEANVPVAWADYGIVDIVSNEDTTVFGSLIPGKEFKSYNAGLQNSGFAGMTDSNLVLVAQITTTGDLSFEINVDVEETVGSNTQIIHYVADGSVLLANEKVSPFLKFPRECGCMDPAYLEYSNAYSCNNADSCRSLIVYGCTDAMACNYDAFANFNMPELCCYPGNCNDRDLEIVCPALSYLRTRPAIGLVYPNPATSRIIVDLRNEAADFSELCLYNVLGKLVLKQNISTSLFEVDLNGLNAGLYHLELKGYNESLKQIIVKNN